jgi:hypothetical protein
VSGGSELGAVDRQAEGELGQGVGWLGVLVGEWWVVDRQAEGELGQGFG